MRYKFLVLFLIITASLLLFIIASLIIFKFKSYNNRTKSASSSNTVPKRISENQSKQGIHIKMNLNGDGIEEKISVLFKYKNTAELSEGYTIDVTSRNKKYNYPEGSVVKLVKPNTEFIIIGMDNTNHGMFTDGNVKSIRLNVKAKDGSSRWIERMNGWD